ncbi:aldose 1-epimerase [Sphingomonas sp. BT-65]|uniref:aldose 1-epimerase n=1 Tax=Sphingomonas sp. BT-65 TaxID=2989821 RepID=UPI002235B54C|nr:aldose 1-epimerase [Sphingomonas sp. BT-65]MCW4462082.1 aldose 1-epimerase [Sphingomonas sp. BT-65]
MKLDAYSWALELLPALGGAIGALRHDGHDVLRPAPRGIADPLAAGCFPLVPYANRIAHGRFAFAGQEHQLPLNFGDHPHSLHGLGWQAAWTIAATGPDRATLAHTHDGGAGWPWAYRAEQRFTLAPERMRVELSLTNAADTPMPAGLGLHPYFPCDAETYLTFTAERVWLADETMLPTESAPAEAFGDWPATAPVAGTTLIDNAYDGWDGAAGIGQRWGGFAMRGEGARVLHLYRPPAADFFCVEPVSHLPDAINRDGMDVLAPGATLRLAMTLSV